MTNAGERDTESFQALIATIEVPSFVVTTAAEGERAGCLVGFTTQCSIEPLRFGVWLSKVNHTYRVAQSATTLVVHLLRADDRDLADRFGGKTGDEVDKFAGVDWSPGPDGCPVLDRLDWFAGSIIDRVDTGDHVLYLLAPWGGRCRRNDAQQLPEEKLDDIEAAHPIPSH